VQEASHAEKSLLASIVSATIVFVCVPVQALLGALVAKVEQGYEPTQREIDAVVGSGCPREEVTAAIARARERRQASRFKT